MKRKTRITAALVAAVLMIAVGTATAAERSGVIVKLVREVHETIRDLVQEKDVLEGQIEMLNEEMDQAFERYKDADARGQSFSMEQARADYDELCAQVNALELKRIKIYQNAIHSLMPKMTGLVREVERQGRQSNEVVDIRDDLFDNMQAVVRVLAVVAPENASDQTVQKAKAIQRNLSSKLSTLSMDGTARTDIARLNESVLVLGDTLGLLEQAKLLLQNERIQLRVDNSIEVIGGVVGEVSGSINGLRNTFGEIDRGIEERSAQRAKQRMGCSGSENDLGVGDDEELDNIQALETGVRPWKKKGGN